MTVLYILIALLMFGLLIFIHEGGHFLAARLFRVTVNEFSIGMGPELWHRTSKKSQTKYALRALPIGGYVSMAGEDEDSDDPNAFCHKSIPKRMGIVVAGALMNLILGFLLMAILVFSGKTLVSTQIGEFTENSVSSQVLCVDDTVTKVGRVRVHTGNELVYEIMNQGDKPVDVTVIRDGETVVVEDVVFGNFEESGVVFGEMDFRLYRAPETFGNYIKHSFWRSLSTVKMVYDSVFNLLTGKYGMQAVSGPVGVTSVVGDAAKQGIETLAYVVCVISINLGVFNLLPFPALDGGRFALLILEGIRHKPLPRKVETYINVAGLLILLAFMAIISVKDIIQLIVK
ncbi:MAG: site-2 protease family protein [Ruminococcaceae bacterium]|nr:site-2 protease family protein [Oscillospiraceae bacterium]